MFRAHRPILRRVHTAVHITIGSYSVCIALAHGQSSTDTVRTNGFVNSCVNSPEDGPVGPKHVEIRQYINKIEIVTSVDFYSIQTSLSKTNCNNSCMDKHSYKFWLLCVAFFKENQYLQIYTAL